MSHQNEVYDLFKALEIETDEKRSAYQGYEYTEKSTDESAVVTFIATSTNSKVMEEE